jgi:YD repeat-containing protein
MLAPANQYKTAYGYDANGSTTSTARTAGGTTTATSYTYDLRNRMSSVTSGGVTTNYSYDEAGNIVGQSSTGTVTKYLRDNNNPTRYSQVLEVFTGGTSPSTTYTIGNSALAQNQGSTISFIMPDGITAIESCCVCTRRCRSSIHIAWRKR